MDQQFWVSSLEIVLRLPAIFKYIAEFIYKKENLSPMTNRDLLPFKFPFVGSRIRGMMAKLVEEWAMIELGFGVVRG
jgi:hypothetical protein